MSTDVALAIAQQSDFMPSPIESSWIHQGDPVTRAKSLVFGPRTEVALWDCTAGEFTWRYGPYDETVHILEGSVRVTGPQGQQHLLQAGDVALFAAGSSWDWVVEEYVKMLAVLHDTRSRPRRWAGLALARARGVLRGLETAHDRPRNRAADQPVTAPPGRPAGSVLL